MSEKTKTIAELADYVRSDLPVQEIIDSCDHEGNRTTQRWLHVRLRSGRSQRMVWNRYILSRAGAALIWSRRAFTA